MAAILVNGISKAAWRMDEVTGRYTLVISANVRTSGEHTQHFKSKEVMDNYLNWLFDGEWEEVETKEDYSAEEKYYMDWYAVDSYYPQTGDEATLYVGEKAEALRRIRIWTNDEDMGLAMQPYYRLRIIPNDEALTYLDMVRS